MNQDLLNILSNSNKDIDNQKLMDYLSGKLSDTEKHEVERWMTENDFASEAMEGLQEFDKGKNMDAYVADLNKSLNQYLNKKKSRREKRKIRDINWIYIAVLCVILFIILAYLVISRLKPAI